jgi:hypothetical protein
MPKNSLAALQEKCARLEEQGKAIRALIKQAQDEQEQKRQILIGKAVIRHSNKDQIFRDAVWEAITQHIRKQTDLDLLADFLQDEAAPELPPASHLPLPEDGVIWDEIFAASDKPKAS